MLRCQDKDQGKSNSSTDDLMEAGTTEQCLNAREGAIEGENEREKRKPAAHSPQDSLPVCESYSAPGRKRRMRPSHIHPSLCGYGSQKNNPLNNKKEENSTKL